MRVTLDHWTTYRYNSAVTLDPHTIRLQPRMSGTQWLLAFSLEILPKPDGTAECLDQDGNLAHYAWFAAPTNQLSIRTRFTVRLLRENPFDFLLSKEPLRLPLWYEEPLSSSLFGYRFTNQIDPTVTNFALGSEVRGVSFSIGLESGVIHDMPAVDPSRGPGLAIGRNPPSPRGSLSGLGGSLLRRLPGDGHSRPLRQRLRMRFSRAL